MGKAGAVSRDGVDGWTAWTPVRGAGASSAIVVAELLDGGQAFRWYRLDDATWIGAWGDHLVQLRRTVGGQLEWSAPKRIAARVKLALTRYLGLEADFATYTDALPWRSDTHLARCVAAFPGLRILRQPFGETLLGFLCSATKQIVQIKQMVGLLAARHGELIAHVGLPPAAVAKPEAIAGLGAVDGIGLEVRALPTWAKLARVPELELRSCLLGFRARYIAETARLLAAHPGWIEETEALPYADAKERLCSLPGVGEKVADCVLLFGAGRLEAFPVDVWILKTMAKRYALHGWKPAQLAEFGRVHFGAYAGLAQQFLFGWERRVGRFEVANDDPA